MSCTECQKQRADWTSSIRQAVADEREECAKMAETIAGNDTNPVSRETARQIAAYIRAMREARYPGDNVAREAFALMVSRGWMPTLHHDGRWYASREADPATDTLGPCTVPVCPGLLCADPFTAIVEAGKTVEARPG